MKQPPDLDIIEFTDPKTLRLISTAYIDEPALGPLADTDGDLAILHEIEGLTSARRTVSLPVPGGVHPDELLTEIDGYGWTYINAAFCYTRATGNRFNGPDRGAWYACFGKTAVKTAQSEVAWHLTRELEAVGIFENITAYRELLAGFTTWFYDLNGAGENEAINPDPVVSYPAGQTLAHDVFVSGGNGLIYPSARNKGGQCLVALRPHLVQNVRQGDTWVFNWCGTKMPTITRA